MLRRSRSFRHPGRTAHPRGRPVPMAGAAGPTRRLRRRSRQVCGGGPGDSRNGPRRQAARSTLPCGRRPWPRSWSSWRSVDLYKLWGPGGPL